MSDTAKVFGTTYTGVTALKVSDGNSGTLTYVRPTGTKSITANGTGIDVTNYAAVDVNVSGGGSGGTYQAKTGVTPTESSQTIEPDSGYDALSSVQISAISSTYVGSGIDQNDSTDLTASGATVTVPAGYYAAAATKSVASGSATTPATTISVTPSISVNSTTGVITASVSDSESVTPTVSAGYVSSGIAGTVTVSGSNTSNLSTKAAATYNTSSSDQTISAGQYLTGAQTIKAVTTDGLSASNVKYGATVKVGDANDDDRIAAVTGTFSGSSTVSSGQTAAAAGQILSGYSAFVDGAEVKGSIASKINLTASTAAGAHTVTAEAGYYASNASRVYPTIQTKTWYPTTSSQTFPPSDGNMYMINGTQTIAAVATSNLTAANIKAGVTVKVGDSADDDRIAGITGTYTSDATASASDIVSGKSAYVNGSKVDGSLTFSTITVSSSNPSGGNNGDIWIKTS